MLDQYFYGSVTRISPEAPVPVNLITREESKPGGAANVVHNLATIGCKTIICDAVGPDIHADILRDLLQAIGVNTDGLINGIEKTTTKARVLGGHQQMIRLDFETKRNLDDNHEKLILQQILKKLEAGLDAVIISDYNKGVCSARLCQSVIQLSHQYHVPVFVDPKGTEWDKYRGADYITSNVKELSDIYGETVKNEDNVVIPAAQIIKNKYQLGNIMVTRSEKGLSLITTKQAVTIPTKAREVYDVSDAGDTVIVSFSAGVAGGLKPYDAAYMANAAAGIEGGKVETYAVSREEILEYLKY